MITANPQKNLKMAKAYFQEHLAKSDYHSQGRTLEGWWFGKGAARLNLDGAVPVSQEAFERLCDNLHPVTREKLTVRNRNANRRVYYDFVGSAPKSVSIMALTVGDSRIIKAHSEACLQAMTEMERLAATRVRRGGRQGERLTGELVAAVFRHETSRALDPQLHTHFVAFNATWDGKEQRWKALQTGPMFDQMTFFTEIYRSELAAGLMKIGYALRPTENGFEIEGVANGIIDRFSKRRRAILAAEPEAVAAVNAKLRNALEQAVRDSAGQPQEVQAKAEKALREFRPITELTNTGRATLAHSSRQRKDNSLSPEEVVARQRVQLRAGELEALRRLVCEGPLPVKRQRPISAAEAIEYSREHLFERHSVVGRHDLLRVALKYAQYGVRLADMETALAERAEFIAVDDMLTTKETLQQELRLVSLVNQGAGKYAPLNAAFAGDHDLTLEQRLALSGILRSSDEVIGLRGGAGTGKSKLLHEVVRGIEQRKKTIVLAPSTAAVEALRKEGLPGTATVQRFLADENFQHQVRDRVLVVDEAGLLSTKDLLALVEYAHTQRSRLVLSGDTRQHAGIEAGDALRLLEQRSNLRMIGVNSIQRQINSEYREAIAEMSQGKGLEGLARLEKLGAVYELTGQERYQRLAADYVGSVKAGNSALIVSPTWREIECVTSEVRNHLKAEGLLSSKETTVNSHRSLKWTRAQKRDLRNYKPELVLNFHKGSKDFDSGEWAEVVRVDAEVLHARKSNGKLVQVTKKQADCFEVAEQVELKVAAGDRLLIQGNRKADKLFNGQMVTVKKLKSNGRVVLTDGRSLAPDFRAFTHGYCVTSHASQGRTVDDVYVAMDSQSFRPTSLNQFYVSASRGRKSVQVFTDDLMFLRRAVTRSATRLSATELIEQARVASREAIAERPGNTLRLSA